MHHPNRTEEAPFDDDVEQKILKYERFIDDKLTPDLHRVLAKRD